MTRLGINRRRLLAAAAASPALAGGTARAAATPAGPGPEMATLSAFMADAANRPLPEDVTEKARQHLLDTLAAMVSGSRLPPGQAALRYIRADGGKGANTVVGARLTAGPMEAALANGVMAHADETDDSHNASRSHPGSSAVPAALAAGEIFGRDGTHLLRAVALGYDVGTRVAMAMGGEAFSYENTIDTHSFEATFGATAAAACAAGLNPQQMRWALDYASQQASGYIIWRRDIDHIEKAFVFGGMAARNGVTAALVVHDGWNGVDDVFTGPDNFFQAYAPKAQIAQLIDKLGERYEIAQTDIKKWTVGSPIQSPLDGVAAIRAKHPFEAGQVRHVTIRLAPSVAQVVDNRDIPDICLQHMVAVMLLDKTASFRAAHDKARMSDPAVLRERAKVTLIGDEDLAKLLPARIAVVEIELNDGTKLAERVTAVRGTIRNPMSRTEVIDKARDLMAPVLGRDITDRLITTVFAIEKLTNVHQLRPLLQGT